MDMEHNLYQQNILYGNKTRAILELLSKERLSKDDVISFEELILEHIQSIASSQKHQLPPFGKDFQWLNISRSLSSEDDLGKKIYVIDFFTYCCINCVHILPYLKEVENKYADNPGFAVIGVHSPKFPNEKNLQQVEEAIIRNNIKHPILNDPYHILWRIFGITCWPTVFIVGPNRILLFVLVGERQIEKLSVLCHHTLKYFESSAVELDLNPLPVSEITKPEINEIGLLFPGNVSTNGENIIVSDTGHNRLVLMSKFLEIKEVIGSGIIGCDDGSFDAASFNSPHGTTWYKDVVYVADTGNHSIRKIDFQQRVVSTMFKTRTAWLDSHTTVKFSSPWDVCVKPGENPFEPTRQYYPANPFAKERGPDPGTLYIAVAGSHQIWALDLETNLLGSYTCLPVAGSGKEENRQNTFRMKASFAQPSGITYSHIMPDFLFVADSESSTIKSISFKSGAVKTIIGGGPDPLDLFKFGDRDGRYTGVKLQHPMGIAVLKDEVLVIADTYNHKLKIVYPNIRECKTLQANIQLNEPSGICILDEMLYVADTNNHRIITIPINEIAPEIFVENYDTVIDSKNLALEDSPQTCISLSNDGKITCYFKITSDENTLKGINSESLDIHFTGVHMDVVHLQKNVFHKSRPRLILRPPASLDKPSDEKFVSEIIIFVPLFTCDETLKVCHPRKAVFKFHVTIYEYGLETVRLNLFLNDDCKT